MLSPGPIFDAVLSMAGRSGLFRAVVNHEPKAAPSTEQGLLTFSLVAGPLVPSTTSGLATVTYRWQLIGRVYTGMLTEPQDVIDPALMNAAGQLMSLLAGEFTLGGLVRQVDLFGAYGEPLTCAPGYIGIDSKLFRTADLLIPLIIDDVDQEIA